MRRDRVSEKRQNKAAAINLWNGSQRGVTDLSDLPRNGSAQTAERLACFVSNGSLRCSLTTLAIRSPPDGARPAVGVHDFRFHSKEPDMSDTQQTPPSPRADL